MAKQEIINKAFYQLPDLDESYIEVLEDMYSVIIENACKFIEDEIIDFVEYDHLNGICIDYGQLNKQFRKAMEEE